MQFCESEEITITIPRYQNTFVYFLIYDKEVLYVGQTSNGIVRPLSHKDKLYDEIKIIYCDKKDLDLAEDKYIQKYKPKYNRQNNYKMCYGLLRVRNCARKLTNNNTITIYTIRNLLKTLSITPRKDIYTDKDCISYDEYVRLMEYLGNSTCRG